MFHTVKNIGEISCAHRLVGHPKCEHLHGHNYKIEVVCSGEEPDKNGMVVDFAKMKEVARAAIEFMDHAVIADRDDTELSTALLNVTPIYYIDGPTTVENIAKHLLKHMNEIGEKCGVQFTEIHVWETSNSYAVITCGREDAVP